MWISLNSTKNNIKLRCANYIKKKIVSNNKYYCLQNNLCYLWLFFDDRLLK